MNGFATRILRAASVAFTRDRSLTVLTALLGPIISVEATKVLGPTYSEYEGEFVTEASQHWQADGSNWAARELL